MLAQAEQSGSQVFVTSDQNLKYQQNLKERKIALLVFSTNFLETLRIHHKNILVALEGTVSGGYIELVFEEAG